MMMDRFDLTGKTALITGAAGLLGREHAAALLEKGAKVVLTDISETSLKSASLLLSETFDEKNIFSYVLDVTNPEAISAVADHIDATGLRVDVLVNNASIDPKVKDGEIFTETSRLENFSLTQWQLEIEVGLTGSFLCSKVFGAKMAFDGIGGVIINIASDLSVISPYQMLYRRDDLPDHLQPVKPVTYSVIKAGLIGLTRYLATYWAGQGVRANALSPGGVFHDQGEEFVVRLSSVIPMRRMAKLYEYRAALQFLCSDASAYLNGQNLIMDGGRSVW